MPTASNSKPATRKSSFRTNGRLPPSRPRTRSTPFPVEKGPVGACSFSITILHPLAKGRSNAVESDTGVLHTWVWYIYTCYQWKKHKLCCTRPLLYTFERRTFPWRLILWIYHWLQGILTSLVVAINSFNSLSPLALLLSTDSPIGNISVVHYALFAFRTKALTRFDFTHHTLYRAESSRARINQSHSCVPSF